MADAIDWLRNRPFYEGQIAEHRRLPARDPEFADIEVEPRLAGALDDRGVDRLYQHQATAIEAVRDGDDVVLATETASGKSLAYTVPAFEAAMDHGGRTLYIGPQNALIADQEESLSELAHGLGFGSRVSVESYTGRLSRAEKRDVRDARPTVLLSNPDMLHYALLPYAGRLWEWFFASLEHVVIDEVHGYRGVFGSQVAMTLRRLARTCERFGSDPTFVSCSATINNPVEHVSTVTGRDPDGITLVDEDTSGRGPRDWVLWNPPEYDEDWAERTGEDAGRRKSSHTESKRLFVDLVESGRQTLTFTRARQTAEQYATDSASELRSRGNHDLAGRVGAYQAALKDGTRRDIEADLHSGELRGVWSTNALELGVDVGGLDAVILDGYPGTRMSAFQQAGRAGRGTDPALVVMVGGEDGLDQYLMNHPEDFFDAPPEDAICDPENDQLLPRHVACAADEQWLSPADEAYFGESFPGVVADLTDDGVLKRRDAADGTRWTHAGSESPQHAMNLRTAEEREIELIDRSSGESIASLGFADALRDAHPGAIYHQQGRTYEVTDLDLDRDIAELDSSWADYYTQVLSEKDMVVNEGLAERTLPARPDVPVRFADVTVTEQITGFVRKDAATGKSLGESTVDLPETTLRTKALYFPVPEDIESEMRTLGDEVGIGGEYGFNGGIHAAEHGIISLFPFHLLCDRADVGGISTPYHPHTDSPAVFVYDGYPGGVGLTRRGHERAEELFARTARLIDGCGCESGCPACVQSPHCGNANEPLAKPTAVRLLESLTGTAGSDDADSGHTV
ncbi:DEAD/DEAH box helicase domain-containing protein [Halorubrum alkaliphilum]|uniref:DEAD/DEAH box helicase domain-containing protein n=1 Tax=Halorubrum alkaliphilum TaxID=261290 RepID=A0A8T4GCK0_9EURY|nr:DEAD/DEAH box helicase [Halorubrum alkaliphilum]MBP1921527.1 DEAD/DEAH box helicase domain-containing protein [Halorubrum alkaliphilum]